MKPKFSELQKKILLKYAELAQKKGYHPSSGQLIEKTGVSYKQIEGQFSNMKTLRKLALEHYPKYFENIVDDNVFSKKSLKHLEATSEKHKRFFITTAVMGCKVHEGFYRSIKSYCRKNGAMLIVLPTLDPAADVPFHLDGILANDFILGDDLALNDNLFLSAVGITAKQIDPVTGLGRIGQRNGSFIFASPKQRLKMIPTSNEKIPHAIMSTGALTKPNYKTKKHLSKRTAYFADHDHVIGGIIVEIDNETAFHFRQVQADSKGSFIDLGVEFRPDGSISLAQPEAFVLGDWHSGETSPIAASCFITSQDSVAKELHPKRIIIHDGFNGMSISHHEVKNKALRAQRASENKLSLEAELEGYRKDLEYFCSLKFVKEVVIVKSNHDEFLDRYLAEGRYVEDAQNHLLSLDLVKAMIEEDANPIQVYMEKKGIKYGHKLTWLKRDEDYKISGVELGAHGDHGGDGARGSLIHTEAAYGQSISGHSHKEEILRGAWQVGTCSILNPRYRKGSSSWSWASCILYKNGSRQLIRVIEDDWRLR